MALYFSQRHPGKRGERERGEREREADRDKERERGERERERERGRQTERERGGETGRWTERERERQADRQRQREKQIERERDKDRGRDREEMNRADLTGEMQEGQGNLPHRSLCQIFHCWPLRNRCQASTKYAWRSMTSYRLANNSETSASSNS